MSTKQRDPKWMKSRSTSYARRAIAEFVEDNADNLSNWLHSVAHGIPKTGKDGELLRDPQGSIIYVSKPDPAAAIAALGNLMEYHLPRLSRAEVSAVVAHEQVDVASMTSAEINRRIMQAMGVNLDQFNVVEGELVEEPLPAIAKGPQTG